MTSKNTAKSVALVNPRTSYPLNTAGSLANLQKFNMVPTFWRVQTNLCSGPDQKWIYFIIGQISLPANYMDLIVSLLVIILSFQNVLIY
jgi:hypothetical protein